MFGQSKEQVSEETNVNVDAAYLDEVAGQGFDKMDSGDVAVPMLLIAQQLSGVATAGNVPAGHFYNSISGKDYGDKIKVIVCHFQKMWVEWKPNAGGFVGRHEIGSIPVTGDIYSGMKHGENDVIETWMYLCVLPEHLEDGYMLFSSTRGNLRYLKGWNTQMKYLRTPSGKPAPLFAAIWEMSLDKDTNKQGKTYFSCNTAGKSSIKQVGWVSKDTYSGYVEPCRQIASEAVALADNRTDAQAIEDNTTEEKAF